MNKMFALFCLMLAINNIESHSKNILKKIKIKNKITENGFKFVHLTKEYSDKIPMKAVFGTNDIDGGNCEIVFRLNSNNSAVTLFKLGNEESNIQSQISIKNGPQNIIQFEVINRTSKLEAKVYFPTKNVNVFDGKWHKIVIGLHDGIADAYLDCKQLDLLAGRDGSADKYSKKYLMEGTLEPISVGIVEQADESLSLDLHALHVYINNKKSLYKCDNIPN